MINILNFKDNYNLINNKFVNLLKNLKTSYLGFNKTKLGFTKIYFFSNNRINSSIFNLKGNGVNFFSTSAPHLICSSNSIRKGDIISNLHSTLALEKTLGVARHKFQAFPFHLVEQSPWLKFLNLTKKNKLVNKRFLKSSSNLNNLQKKLDLNKTILNPIFLVKDLLVCPTIETENIIKAVNLAETIYSSIPDNNVPKFFVKAQMDKSIKLNYSSSEISNILDLRLLGVSYKNILKYSSIVQDPFLNVSLSNLPGCYFYFHPETEKLYFGSSLNVQIRHKAHKDELRKTKLSKFNKFIKLHGWKGFKLGVIYNTFNLFQEFKKNHPTYKLSKGEAIFLLQLSELHVKLLEQSLITIFKPNLNSSGKVNFVYNTWDLNWLSADLTLSPRVKNIIVFDEKSSEPILGPLSINKIKIILQVSKDIVPRYLNNIKFFYSPGLGFKVRVQELNVSSLNKNQIIHRKQSISLNKIDFDIDSLEKNKIFILNSDFTFLKHNGAIKSFDTLGKAIKFLDFEKYNKLIKAGNRKFEYVRNYINLNKLVKTSLGEFYFACNPQTINDRSKLAKAIPIVLLDTRNMQVQEFVSINSLISNFNIKRFRYESYLDKPKIWNKHYRLFTIDNFFKLYPKI